MTKGQNAKKTTIMSTTTVVSIGGNDYLIDRKPLASINLTHDGKGAESRFLDESDEQRRYVPATTISYDELAAATRGWKSMEDNSQGESQEHTASLNARTLATLINTYHEVGDDVWTEDFLEVIIINDSKTSSSCEPSISSTGPGRWVIHLAASDKRMKITPGPYVIDVNTGKIYAVRRLFQDTNDCFVSGALHDEDIDRFEWLSSIDRIPVPSRLSFPNPNPTKHLNGLRFGVKDVIDIAGLETGCGSADYRAFYPPREATAVCVQRLIDAGAVMVGKMRTCMWCDGQDPLERFEEPTPINPRGDRFQKPSGSSSGSAAGCASYEWLDFTIGTDTGGSIRHPAAVNGVYGIRPSLGSTGPLSGLVCSELTDTIGVFARSPNVVRDVMRAMFDQASGFRADNGFTRKTDVDDGAGAQKPTFRLLYATTSLTDQTASNSPTPQFFIPKSASGLETQTDAHRIFEDFVLKFERILNCTREEISIADLWSQTHPRGTPGSMIEMMDGVYQDIVYRDLAKSTVDPFVKDFMSSRTNIDREFKRPFIEPSTRKRLEYGSNVSDEDYEKAVDKLKTFGAWVNDVLLPHPPTSTRSKAMARDNSQSIPFLIYPQTWGTARYRDELVKRDGLFWTGFSPYSLAYASGGPDFTLPVGEVCFLSKVTGKEEYLPVTISLLGPKGCDELMLDLVAELEKKSALSAVKSGRRLF